MKKILLMALVAIMFIGCDSSSEDSNTSEQIKSQQEQIDAQQEQLDAINPVVVNNNPTNNIDINDSETIVVNIINEYGNDYPEGSEENHLEVYSKRYSFIEYQDIWLQTPLANHNCTIRLVKNIEISNFTVTDEQYMPIEMIPIYDYDGMFLDNLVDFNVSAESYAIINFFTESNGTIVFTENDCLKNPY